MPIMMQVAVVKKTEDQPISSARSGLFAPIDCDTNVIVAMESESGTI